MEKMGLYGYIAGMVSAVLLQPLDNIKMVLMMPPKDLKLTHNFITNAQLSVKYLQNDQGFRSFYRGLIPNVIKNGFGSAVYFSTLRFAQKINRKYQISDPSSFSTNFVLSSFGRILSSIASNPFIILQTRYQMAGSQRWSGSLAKGLKKLYTTEGTKGCFKGCLVNCYKEGIFAGLFYGMYQQGKKLGINSSLSAMASGMLATLLSHPLQIVRAQLQTSSIYVSPHGEWLRMSIKQQLIQLYRQGELFKGVSPRLIKKPLANTITFLLFQAMETNKYQNY